MIYPIRKVEWELNLRNEQISIRITGEIHENSKKNANLIGFLNRLSVSFNLTDSQPLDSIFQRRTSYVAYLLSLEDI